MVQQGIQGEPVPSLRDKGTTATKRTRKETREYPEAHFIIILSGTHRDRELLGGGLDCFEGRLGVGSVGSNDSVVDDELVLLGGASEAGDLQSSGCTRFNKSEDGLDAVLVVVRALHFEGETVRSTVGQIVLRGSSA